MVELQYLEGIRNHMKSRNVGLLGCTMEEVSKIEAFYGVKLPRAYVEYLLVMGKYSGPLNVGTSSFYDDLLDLKEVAQELLDDSMMDFQLSKNAFVFEIHQSYTFYFFETGQSDNPEVLGYTQNDDKGVHKAFDSYVAYWEAMIPYLDEMLNKWNSWKNQ